MASPLVSIIVTTYNYAHTVGIAIDSALAQTYQPIEVVVVDNASTDATPELMERYRDDPRVRYVRNPENIGMVPNHNKGLRESQGEYVAFLSADDFLMPDFLKRSFAFLDAHPNVEVVYCTTYFVNDRGNFIGTRGMHGQPLGSYAGGRNEFADLLAEGCYMCFPTMLMRRDLYDRFGELDEDIKAADYEIVVRWALRGVRFGYDPEPTAAVRLHDAQQSSDVNYASLGGSLTDMLYLLDKFVTPETEAALSGHELKIARHLNALAHHVTSLGATLSTQTRERTDRWLRELEGRAERSRIRTGGLRLAVVVLYQSPLERLIEETLASLESQTTDAWQGLVVQIPMQTSIAPLVDYHTRAGRFQTVRMTDSVSEAVQVALAMRVCDADCFLFLHAGSTLGPDTLRTLGEAFAMGAEIVRLPVRASIETVGPAGTMVDRQVVGVFDDVFPAPTDYRMLGIAPATPLDAMAFRRTSYDAIAQFNPQLITLSHWDALLRMSIGRRSASTSMAVRIPLLIGVQRNEFADPGLLASIDSIYGAAVVNDPGMLEARVRYVQGLREFLTRDPNQRLSPQGLYDGFRAFSGAALLAPVPAAV